MKNITTATPATNAVPLKPSSTRPVTTSGAPPTTNGSRRVRGDPRRRSETGPETSGTTSANAPSPPINAPTTDGECTRGIRTTGPYVVTTLIPNASPNV